jgi:hypothetical protein
MPTANDSGAVTFSATYKGQVIKLTFIVTKSKSGANGSSISGANGISTYTVDMYLAVNQASTPTAPAGGTYNFGTKVFTPPNANWTLTQPASSTVPTWACTYTFFTTNSPTETVTAGTWTNVRTVAQNGASIQGNAGNSAVRVFAFNASSGTPPTAPSGNITTALPATPVADTWYTSPITLAVNKFQWQCDGIKDATTTTWASPYLSVFKVDTLAAFVVNTGALTVSDKLTIGANGKIASGQTAYDTGKGFWLESSGKFSVGDSAGKKIAFDGSTLTLNGELVLNGNLSTNAVSTVKIAANQVTENTITTAGFTSLNIPANSGSASNSTTVINMFTFPSVDISTVRPVLVQFTLEHFDTTAGYISVNCAGNSIVTDVPVRLTDGSNVTTFTFLFNVTIAANTTSASGGLVITLNNGATANYWNATSPPAVSNVKLLVMTGKR